MKNIFLRIIHILLGGAIACLMIVCLIKPSLLMEYVSILSIIAFALLVIEIFVCHFYFVSKGSMFLIIKSMK